IRALGLARATTHAAVSMGLVLAGLAPVTALFVVTSEDLRTATIVAIAGLIVGGAFGIRGLTTVLSGDQIDRAKDGATSTNHHIRAATIVFVVFACVLAARIWYVTLPLLSGAA